MRYKLLLIVLLSICYSTKLYGQDSQKHDSLRNILRLSKHDTTRIELYNEIGASYEYELPDTAIFYYNKAIYLADEALESATPKSKIIIMRLKANSLWRIGIVFRNKGIYDKAIENYFKSFKISEEIGDKIEMSERYNNIGIVYFRQGDYDKTNEYFLKSLKLSEEIGNKKRIAGCYINIGNVYIVKGSYDNAIEYYIKALKIFEEIGDKRGISYCYSNIGGILEDQHSYDKALENYLNASKITKEIGDKIGMASCYNNIGNIYNRQLNFDKAIEFLYKSLKIREEIGDKSEIADSYICIGHVYKKQGNYNKAINYFHKSLKIREEIGDRNGIANCWISIARLNISLADSVYQTNNKRFNHLNKAVEYGLKAISLSKEIEVMPQENDAAGLLKNAYKKLGNYRKALKYAELYISTKDSMFSDEKTKALAEMQTKYEAEKKQLQIDVLNKENSLKKAELARSEEKRSKQLILIYFFIAGFIIISVFSAIIFRLFKQKKKANLILEKQKQQIEEQNNWLNQANKEITTQRDKITAQRDLVTEQKARIEGQKKGIDASIQYAKRIQTAVLPTDKYIDSVVGKYFIIFRPRSVVSGDFYWATQTEEWTVITVADCTGHGVPGAFMSMLGISFLNEIVRKKEITNTAEILNQLRSSVIDALKQTKENHLQKDGLDISIVAIHKDRKIAYWAGANNPLWIIRHNSLINHHENIIDIVEVVKPDKMPVSVYVNMKPFTNHKFKIETGDRLYLFSDGFTDQFGGAIGKKFMSRAFKELLIKLSSLPMQEQGEQLENELDKWMNYGKRYEQIDDITVFGLEI